MVEKSALKCYCTMTILMVYSQKTSWNYNELIVSIANKPCNLTPQTSLLLRWWNKKGVYRFSMQWFSVWFLLILCAWINPLRSNVETMVSIAKSRRIQLSYWIVSKSDDGMYNALLAENPSRSFPAAKSRIHNSLVKYVSLIEFSN